MRTLTLKRKITVFNALGMSKIVHLALVTNFPTSTMTELNKIQKEFFSEKKSKNKTYYFM